MQKLAAKKQIEIPKWHWDPYFEPTVTRSQEETNLIVMNG